MSHFSLIPPFLHKNAHRSRTFYDVPYFTRICYQFLRQLPSACPICGLSAKVWSFCHSCHALYVEPNYRQCTTCGLKLSEYSDYCSDCSRRLSYFRATQCGFSYSFPLDRFILQLKNQRQLQWAPLLAALIYQRAMASQLYPNTQLYTFIPVPSQRDRIQHRGFNVARELCRYLSIFSGYPTTLGWLKKKASSQKQSSLSQQERLTHYQETFYLDPSISVPTDMTLIIVDDIMTTGSTANAIAKVLSDAGYPTVDVWVAARTHHQ